MYVCIADENHKQLNIAPESLDTIKTLSLAKEKTNSGFSLMGKNPHWLGSVLFGFYDYKGSVRFGFCSIPISNT